ncbi:hypothetical protein GE061_011748 [Apolygus lucorum]|uniref:Peptidase S1 domain-containing protein n=1 Tax=Apolygus lucorum TaxID=248454 RepID=A0A8S9XZS5_APOLU|nr:hypothetical protein GE061_011748 [Apolygus lucorum]
MDMIFQILLLFHGTFALYSDDEYLGMTSTSNHSRKKRLVYGLLVQREETEIYPLTQYQAALISPNFCTEGLMKELEAYLAKNPGRYDPATNWDVPRVEVESFIFNHCPFDKSRSFCGGTAITEWTVQTSCSCIARFVDKKDEKTGQIVRMAQRYNAWEDMVFMVIGAIVHQRQNTPYVSKEFLIHQKCRQVFNTTISHNIGIVVFRYRIEAGTTIAAPTSMEEITKQWYYVVDKETVCHVVGWGSTAVEARDAPGEQATNLRLTWRVVRSFVYCYETHRAVYEFIYFLRANKLTYKDLQSWSCTTDFGKLRSIVTDADSGGPMACVQGWYFSVLNWGAEAYGKNDTSFTVTTGTDIVYAMFENAWDYRYAFNEYIFELITINLLLVFHQSFAFYSHAQDAEVTSGNSMARSKRLIFGQPVDHLEQEYLKKHEGTYNPASDWSIPIDLIKNMIFTHCPIDKTRSYCGGTAITEFAIQTSCHCIARFDTSYQGSRVFPKAFNAWEDLLFMFVGALAFEKGNTPYVSRNFIIHQKCEQYYNLTISHNIGIIVLRYRLQDGTTIAAPTSMEEMVRQWDYVLDKEAVCLVVGWGSTEFEGRDIYGLPSLNLRKTWKVIRSFVYCYYTHVAMFEFIVILNLLKETYKDVQTWSCSTDFGKMRAAIGHGDSGGPVACVHGWYFSIMNWGRVAYGENDTAFYITTESDIIYAMYENGWEFRPAFNDYIHDLFLIKASPFEFDNILSESGTVFKPGRDYADHDWKKTSNAFLKPPAQ